MIFLISVGVFLTLCTVTALVYQLSTAEKRAVVGRLVQVAQGKSEPSSPVDRSYQDPQASGLRGILRGIGKHLESPRWNLSLEHRMLRAGLPLRSGEFLALCGAAAVLTGFLFLLIGGGTLLPGAFGGLIGFFFPFLLVRIKTRRRMRAFNSQLGDALILIANSLRTGYSFMQALDMVAQEMRPPISTEFGRAVKEMNLGVPVENALGNLAKRIDSEDLDLVLTSVLIQRQVGGNLSEVLDNIARTIRERVRIRGEIRTMTAQGRISGIIISLLPIALGLVIYTMNPGYVRVLFVHPIGQLMLGVAVVGQIIGVFVIRRIVDIEV